MEVEGALRRQGQDVPRQYLAEVEREDHVRRQTRDLVDHFGTIHRRGLEDRDSRGAGPLGDRTKPDRLARIILVRHDGGDIRAERKELIQADVPDVLIRHHDEPHDSSASSR